MLTFIFTEVVTLLIIIALLIVLSAVWPPDSPWAPWWQMPDDVIQKMCKMAKISQKDTIYDLGCGTGKALIYACSTFYAKGVGIEIDPIRFWIAKWNVWNSHMSSPTRSGIQEKNGSRVKPGMTQLTLLKKNFFTVDLSSATIIFAYLVPAALKRLTPKFLKELRPGTKFLSYVYPMPEELFKGKLQLIEHDKKMRIYYYQLFAESKK